MGAGRANGVYEMKTLSLVIPCFNEAERLSKADFLDALSKWPWLSFCFVDDGSTDSTAEKIAHLERLSPSVRALYLPKNMGKAEAVRTGIRYLCKNACADYIGFWDADLATPLDEIPSFMRHFEERPHIKAVIGSRWPHLGGNIQRNKARKLTGWIAKSIIRRILKAQVWDTQCGAKIFSRSLAEEIFDSQFRTKWLFDIELLMRIGCRRLSDLAVEHPVHAWSDVPGSKLGIDAIADFITLIKLSLSQHRQCILY